MRAFKFAFFLALLPLAASAQPGPGKAAGTAALVAGSVSAVAANGEARLLKKDDAVYAGDRVITGSAGYVRLGFLDGGAMTLRPKTEFLIEGFSFDPGLVETKVKVVEPAKPAAAAAPTALQIGQQQATGTGNQAIFRLVRGGFRAVSGLIGKINREDYAVRTAVATIGIRGTVYFAIYCDAVCAADPMVQASLPAGDTALGGLVSGVDQGAIAVSSGAGNTALVESSKFLLTTASGAQIALPGLPGFLAAEGWMQAAAQQAAAPNAGATASSTASTGAAAGSSSSALTSAGLSTVPALGGVAAAVAATAAALAFDGDDTNSGSGTSGTTGTGPTQTR